MSVYVYHWVPLKNDNMLLGFSFLKPEDAALMLEGQHPDFKYKLVAVVEGDDLEKAFELTNTIYGPWWENEGLEPVVLEYAKGARSTSVGDLMVSGGKNWFVAPVGFKEVNV